MFNIFIFGKCILIDDDLLIFDVINNLYDFSGPLRRKKLFILRARKKRSVEYVLRLSAAFILRRLWILWIDIMDGWRTGSEWNDGVEINKEHLIVDYRLRFRRKFVRLPFATYNCLMLYDVAAKRETFRASTGNKHPRLLKLPFSKQ